MRTVQIDHFITNPDNSIEVGYHVDDNPIGSASKVYASYDAMIADNREFTVAFEDALRIGLASWLGVDPTGGNQDLATQFRVEMDPAALVSVRRILST